MMTLENDLQNAIYSFKTIYNKRRNSFFIFSLQYLIETFLILYILTSVPYIV